MFLVGVSIGSGILSLILILFLVCVLAFSLRKKRKVEREPLLPPSWSASSEEDMKFSFNKLRRKRKLESISPSLLVATSAEETPRILLTS